ncbi:MAG: hypothetical protein IH951_11850 [Bacteroidetes bacterium]|nr:hypothetical protein [Bacteroidota bacterium]
MGAPITNLGTTTKCCPPDCCPEQVEVTVENTNVTINGAALDPIVVTQISPTQADVVLQASIAASIELEVWFGDTALPDDPKSVVPPNVPGHREFQIITDATGAKTLRVENATLITRFLHVSLGGFIVTSPAITVGV